MAQSILTPTGTCEIDGEQYVLVRTQEARSWKKEFLPEPRYQAGLPSMLSQPQLTWHLGGLKSKQGLPGTSEYGQNTDTRFPFRLLPGPKLETLLSNLQAGDSPTSYEEALGYLWICAGQRVYRVNPTDDSVVLSKDFGAGVLTIMALAWEDGYLYVTTDAADQSLWQVSAVGAPDTWTQAGAGVKAYRLASSHDTLFRVSKVGIVRKIATTLSPLVEANWADSVQMGNMTDPPTGMESLLNTVLVGKPDGFFGVDENGFGRPIIRRIPKSSSNGKGMYAFEPYIMMPHGRGLYRFTPGNVETCGIELEMLNESPVKGIFNAFTSDGQWLYGIIPVDPDIYIMAGREARGQESGFGPIIWDTLMYVPNVDSSAIFFSTLWTNPSLIFAGDNVVYRIPMQPGLSQPVTYNGSGVRYTAKLDFDDTNDKDFPKFDVAGKSLNSDRYWEFAYSVDEDSYQTLDINGDTMVVTDDEHHTFGLPVLAFGKTIQFRATYTDNTGDGSIPGEILHFEPFAIPQSKKVPVITAQLHLATDIKTDRGFDRRSADDQLAALQTLSERAGSVTSTGPWVASGDALNVSVRDVVSVEMIQAGSTPPEHLVSVQLQVRESS
jgi:hypothetical protein